MRELAKHLRDCPRLAVPAAVSFSGGASSPPLPLGSLFVLGPDKPHRTSSRLRHRPVGSRFATDEEEKTLTSLRKRKKWVDISQPYTVKLLIARNQNTTMQDRGKNPCFGREGKKFRNKYSTSKETFWLFLYVFCKHLYLASKMGCGYYLKRSTRFPGTWPQ